jgi:hypothetical protein
MINGMPADAPQAPSRRGPAVASVPALDETGTGGLGYSAN